MRSQYRAYCTYLDFEQLLLNVHLMGVIGTKVEAVEIKTWLAQYLRSELGFELSEEKTLITNVLKRVRFLGYDIRRWKGERRLRFQTKQAAITKRTSSYQLGL